MLLVVLLCALTGVFNSSAGLAAERPCQGDMVRFCKETPPGTGAVLRCLSSHVEELSETCRERVQISLKRIEALQRSCTADANRFCKDVEPGKRRIQSCLRQNFSQLSAACQSALPSPQLAGAVPKKEPSPGPSLRIPAPAPSVSPAPSPRPPQSAR